jgi:hypothetical protein
MKLSRLEGGMEKGLFGSPVVVEKKATDKWRKQRARVPPTPRKKGSSSSLMVMPPAVGNP